MVASLGIIYHRLLGIPFTYARGGGWRQFMLFLMSAILVLRSL